MYSCGSLDSNTSKTKLSHGDILRIRVAFRKKLKETITNFFEPATIEVTAHVCSKCNYVKLNSYIGIFSCPKCKNNTFLVRMVELVLVAVCPYCDLAIGIEHEGEWCCDHRESACVIGLENMKMEYRYMGGEPKPWQK